MTRKKKTITKNKREIFDENGKLIIPKNNKKNPEVEVVESEKSADTTITDVEQKVDKKPILTEEELQEKKRAYWNNYYNLNKEKYKQWNKNWREKQKKEKKVS